MQNKTVTYTYDIGGNIVSKKEYAYTTGTLGTVIDTKNYTYDTVWKDKLASYDGNVINYDKMGNPTNYVSKDLSENDVAGALEYDGRQLVKATNISENCEYIYNENGLMTKKLVYENCDIDSNGKLVFSDLQSTFTYYWNDSKLTGYTLVNSSDGSFFNVKVMYGIDDEPLGYTITGDNDFEMGFFYTKNLQGDITGIYTLEGTSCLLFSYDAYGIPTYTVGDSFIGARLSLVLNPFLYRGYMYDINTGLYYLQSRFYNPIYGRFLNADETEILHFTQGDVHGANLYAYCGNNPVMYVDISGHMSVLAIIILIIVVAFIIFGIFLDEYRNWLIEKSDFSVEYCQSVLEQHTYNVISRGLTGQSVSFAPYEFFAQKNRTYNDVCDDAFNYLYNNSVYTGIPFDSNKKLCEYSKSDITILTGYMIFWDKKTWTGLTKKYFVQSGINWGLNTMFEFLMQIL